MKNSPFKLSKTKVVILALVCCVFMVNLFLFTKAKRIAIENNPVYASSVAPPVSFYPVEFMGRTENNVLYFGNLGKNKIFIFNFFLFFVYYIYFIVNYFIYSKKTQEMYSWGIVYDSVTKQGIAFALVRLYKKEKKTFRLKQTVVTNLNGRFNIISEKGTFKVEVSKSGYNFPSSIVNGIKDGNYVNVYNGNEYNVYNDRKDLFNFAIPLDIEREEKSLFLYKIKIKNFFRNIKTDIWSIVFILGLFVNLTLLFFEFSLLNTYLLVLYVLLFICVEFTVNEVLKPWGVVYDSHAGAPLASAALRLICGTSNRVIKTVLTDKYGRYCFSVPKGYYRVEVLKEGYRFPSKNEKLNYNNNYHGEKIELSGYSRINKNIPIDPK